MVDNEDERPARGRPRKDEPRTVQIGVSLTAAGAELLDKMRTGSSRQDFIRQLLQREAVRRGMVRT